jgi:DNA-binding NarL/FixJ family response regulator
MSYATPSPRETAIENWNHALQTYRASIDLYTQVVKIQHRRGTRGLPVAALVVATAVDSTPSPAPMLDNLTPREREVAMLIARGFSNRRIAQELVITQGTAANHVAHIIDKLGLANRMAIALAVVARTEGPDGFSGLEPILSPSQSSAASDGSPRAPFARLLDPHLI